MMQPSRQSPAGRRRLRGAISRQASCRLWSARMQAALGRCKSSTIRRTPAGVLVNWSLNITPQITVTPVERCQRIHKHISDRLPRSAIEWHLHDPARSRHARRFWPRIGYRRHSAGLDVLRGQQQNGPTTTVLYTASDNLPKAIPAPGFTGPGVVSVHDRGARQLHRSGRHHFGGSKRATGTDQPRIPT